MRRTWLDVTGFEDGERGCEPRNAGGTLKPEKGKGTDPSLEHVDQSQPYGYLDFSPVRHISDFGPPEL